MELMTEQQLRAALNAFLAPKPKARKCPHASAPIKAKADQLMIERDYQRRVAFRKGMADRWRTFKADDLSDDPDEWADKCRGVPVGR